MKLSKNKLIKCQLQTCSSVNIFLFWIWLPRMHNLFHTGLPYTTLINIFFSFVRIPFITHHGVISADVIHCIQHYIIICHASVINLKLAVTAMNFVPIASTCFNGILNFAFVVEFFIFSTFIYVLSDS